MEIKLAGYNVEADLLETLNPSDNEPLTPETISAAYARISRSSKDITALRKEAREDVVKTRKSNQRIIFTMGHHSIAEHAVFNFDIMDVSRLALEEIESFRLVSYTEKSQRYVTLKGDYVLPLEIKDKKSVDLFKETLVLQNEFYAGAYDILKDYLFDKYPEKAENKSDRKLLQGWAKEDARYILSLAARGQVGLTINARNLEHLFRRFAISRRVEVQTIGKKLFSLVEKIAPSLILFPEPSAFESALTDTGADSFKQDLLQHVPDGKAGDSEQLKKPVILHHTQNADDIILASFLVRYHAVDYRAAYDRIINMGRGEKENIFKELFKGMEFFDAPPREFEFPDVTFQVVVSASNYAQLKRHRLATLVPGDYNIAFGNVIPENIKITGLEKEFKEIVDITNRAYLKLKEKYHHAADYVLTNSHCRMVIMKMNLREIYHFIRLRDDEHAQWDIRNLAHHLLQEIKEIMPLSTMLLCGKSDFVKEYEKLYNKQPGFLI